MSFFAIYSQRFVVYDYLNTHYKYSDTLSKDEVKEAKAYLDEQEQVDFMNHTQIRKDLNQLLKKGSYQVILYKTISYFYKLRYNYLDVYERINRKL